MGASNQPGMAASLGGIYTDHLAGLHVDSGVEFAGHFISGRLMSSPSEIAILRPSLFSLPAGDRCTSE
jgi:hypothetical protein